MRFSYYNTLENRQNGSNYWQTKYSVGNTRFLYTVTYLYRHHTSTQLMLYITPHSKLYAIIYIATYGS